MFWKIVKIIGQVVETVTLIPAIIIGFHQIWKKK